MKKRSLIFLAILSISLFVSACNATSEPVLKVSGTVEASFIQKELEAFEMVSAAYTKKDGSVNDHSGIPINDILSAANVAKFGSLTLIASDGYEAEISSDELSACVDCILAFDEEDGLSAVMPYFSSKLQVKSVVELKVQ